MLSRFSLTLWDPEDCSPPGSSVHGILQAKDWSVLSFPSLGDLPDPGIKLASLIPPKLVGGLPLAPPGKLFLTMIDYFHDVGIRVLKTHTRIFLPANLLSIYSFIHSLMYQIFTKHLRGASTSLGTKVKVAQSCPILQPHGLLHPWDSPGQNMGVRSLFLLQGIFSTQRLNPGLRHCRQILYQLSHKRSPRILEWVAYPFSNGFSRPRI